MRFTKMNGLGNDYIFVDTKAERVVDPQNLAKKLSDRHFSVGGDGLVLIGKSDVADLSMRIFNSDGSEAELCGNALRCVGKYAYDNGLVRTTKITVETLAGVKKVAVFLDEYGCVKNASVTIGRAMKGFLHYPFHTEATAFGVRYNGYCVSVGNPHFVIFVREFGVDLPAVGEQISRRNGVFSCGANVEFVKPTKQGLSVRVIERGSGETYACGTGAAATFFVAKETGLVVDKAVIRLKGGTLSCTMTNKNEINVFGEVCENFTGEVKTE